MLHNPPTSDDLARIYFELGRLGARLVGRRVPWSYDPQSPEDLLALAADMSRYDPRLLEGLIEYLCRSWESLHPTRLRRLMPQMRTPQVFGVIGAFVRMAITDVEVGYYFDYLMQGVVPVPLQFYFHHLYAPGSALASLTAAEGIEEFRRWGFLSTQRPTLAGRTKPTVGSYGPAVRQNIRRRLLARQGEMSMGDYRRALHHSISRQQAYLDLREDPLMRPVGGGRGTRWQLIKT